MKLEVKKTSELVRELAIKVEQESLKDIKEKVLKKISQQVSVPGFRKGNAPHDIIEKRHQDLVKDELFKEAIPFYCNKALEQEQLEVISMPQIKSQEYRQGELSFVASIELRPQVEVDEKLYRGLKLKQPEVKVEDKEVDKFIDQLKDTIVEGLGKKKEEIDLVFLAHWSGYKNEEEFRKTIQAELYIGKMVQRRRDLEKQVSDTLSHKVKCTIPESLVLEQTKHLLSQHLMNLRSRGVPEEEVKKHYEEISRNAEVSAREQIKLFYILEAIARKENIKYKKENIYELVVGFVLSSSLK